MAEWMSAHQRYHWQMALQLRLIRLHGDAFQDFFSSVMSRAYGSDFFPVRPHGSKGDMGCDGYRQSSGEVFQCYGKQTGSALKVEYVSNKIKTDFQTAKEKLHSVMREWCFVHNLVEGMPMQILLLMQELEASSPPYKISQKGYYAIEAYVFQLQEAEIVNLLGPAATAEDVQNLQPKELRDLISFVIQGIQGPIDSPPPQPVPFEKLDFNQIKNPWRHLVEVNAANARYVRNYLDEHPDPEVGNRVAQFFKLKYADLKAQSLPPNLIMTKLYELIVGVGIVTIERQVAAQALISYLFDACEIFEDHPQKVGL
jgi:hypothetical protein